LVYAAASVLAGLLEFILYSCEDPCCKVSASVKQNISIACGDMLFGTLALAFEYVSVQDMAGKRSPRKLVNIQGFQPLQLCDSVIISSTLKSSPFQRIGSQAKVPVCLNG